MARKPMSRAPAVVETPAETPGNPNIVTNPRKGVTLHLGDGRRLAFGESAEVAPGLAGILRERGQVE